MEDVYLIGYNDDNHETQWYFEGDAIGTGTDVIETIFYISQDYPYGATLHKKELYIGDLDLTDEDLDLLHESLCYGKNIEDKMQWKLLVKGKYTDYVNYLKIKKILQE